MLLGGLLMVLLVVALNKSVDKKEDTVKKQTRIVKMKKVEKTVVKKQKPKRQAKARRTKTAPKVQPPDLSSMVGGD